MARYVLWFDEVTIKDVPKVGGKNASLGEMYRNLTGKGVNIPNGFAVTAEAYFHILEKAGIRYRIKEILSDLDTKDVVNLAERGSKVRKLIREAHIPIDLQKEIIENYKKLSKEYNSPAVDVAVRSSATAEDLPDASFAGQQETFLNIRGPISLIEACMKCFASLFTDRAISYRVDKGFDHFSIGLSVAIQKMVRSDKASSGVMFSIDTESGFKEVVFITGAYGLGENVVQGAVNPDEYYVFKPTMKKAKNPIISKELGSKKVRMIYTSGSKTPVKNIPVPEKEQHKFVLDDKEILKLAEWACIIEDHYSKKAGHYKPMDMEWAKDGISGKLYIVQARPETVQSQKQHNVIEKYVLKQKGKIIVSGRSVGDKIGQGHAHVIKNVRDINQFRKGEVLVTEMTDPDWEPIMKHAAAIVTDKGGRTCHAAIVSRELGIPCVVGTLTGSHEIKNNQDITVDCSDGSEGNVYEGFLKFEVVKQDVKKLAKTRTKVMMNLGNPEEAFQLSHLPCRGVGLAREEFIINSYIKIHPLALLHYEKITNSHVKEIINKLTFGYKDKGNFFVDKLSYGIAKIAAAFYPEDVVVRLSDFKSNEYANLIGGKEFEPVEDNPMIGWRGASRYYDEKYKEAFGLECEAIKKVRNEMGLTNVIVMIPFCRTVEEGKKVLDVMAKNGLKQGKNKLKVYVMCEIPSNVILAEEFLDIFDGFSIGSNDLTQLTLGLDRDSELVSHIYDERNKAVRVLIEQVIKTAKKKKKHMGFCGDAPSSIPEYAEFLVKAGIESLSVTPDAVTRTLLNVIETEKK
ncbi:phosphoenolpyruvate synthase [Candidatus Woesearchaeota archaeon]|nr:phosphoenolpyruvate synthase [Candidatus Woesearchaeota archaeon]